MHVPDVGAHEAVVQVPDIDEQSTGVPPQVPAVQRSIVVQRAPSLQVVPSGSAVRRQLRVAASHDAL